ncbi:MAG: 5-formyltetrahydrofolate cyclo-ligase [Thermodesulfobacteriota bacterium]
MRLIEEKRRLRAIMLERRLKVPFEEVFELSRRVQENFISTPEFKDSKRIALYASFRNEVLTDDILTAAVKERKEVFFPKLLGPDKIAFFAVRAKTELVQGSHDIPEPVRFGREENAATFDLMVAPGVVFDENGGRIGYGKGYYDRILSEARCRAVALAFDFQVITKVPSEEHDMTVDAIVTERRIIRV